MALGAGMAPGAGNSASVEGIRGAAATGSPTGGVPSAPTSDRVDITEGARVLAALSSTVQAAPDIDAARVATLQEAIDTGTYRVDADQIAGRLLQLEQELAGAAS